MARFELAGDAWAIVRIDNRLEITSEGRTVTRTFKTAEHAEAQEAKLVAEKLAAGYRPALHDPRHPDLEAAIVAEPDAPGPYAVLGDWLQQQGDPRGQLVGLALGEPSPRVAAAIATLLREHADYLVGPLGGDAQTFEWRWGFIHRAQLEPEVVGDVDGVLTLLLQHPSGRFLVELRAGGIGQPAIDALAAAAPATLRGLHVSASDLDLTRLWPAVPELRRLTISGERFEHGTPVLPKLEQLRLRDETLRASTARRYARASWPRLQLLEVDFGQLFRGDASIDELQAWLARPDLAALTHLSLHHVRLLDELLRDLAFCPVAAQLETLELVAGNLTDAAARELADKRASFPRLTRLHVAKNRLTETGQAALRAAFPNVRY
jgi:uncharacterized protein (TIGR02996 family)